MCTFLNEDNTTLVWDSEQQVPFAYRDDQWVGFDDERSLVNKVKNTVSVLLSFKGYNFCNKNKILLKNVV